MARAGAGEALALSPDSVFMPMAPAAIALCFASNASAHGGGIYAEGSHHDRKLGGYHCHRGGGSSSHSDAVSTNSLDPSGIAPARVSRDSGVYVNCAEARAVSGSPVRRYGRDTGMMLI